MEECICSPRPGSDTSNEAPIWFFRICNYGYGNCGFVIAQGCCSTVRFYCNSLTRSGVLWDRRVRQHTSNDYTINLFPSLNTKRASLTLHEQIEASQVEQAPAYSWAESIKRFGSVPYVCFWVKAAWSTLSENKSRSPSTKFLLSVESERLLFCFKLVASGP